MKGLPDRPGGSGEDPCATLGSAGACFGVSYRPGDRKDFSTGSELSNPTWSRHPGSSSRPLALLLLPPFDHCW